MSRYTSSMEIPAAYAKTLKSARVVSPGVQGVTKQYHYGKIPSCHSRERVFACLRQLDQVNGFCFYNHFMGWLQSSLVGKPGGNVYNYWTRLHMECSHIEHTAGQVSHSQRVQHNCTPTTCLVEY